MSIDPQAGAALLFAPILGDAEALRAVLAQAGLDTVRCAGVQEFYARLEQDALLAVITEEGLAHCAAGDLEQVLRRQPPWSDIPLLALADSQTTSVDDERFARLAGLGNFTLVERPTSRQVLLMSIRSAIRARRLQYAVRDHWQALESHSAQLETAVEERTRSLELEIRERRRAEAALAEAHRLESLGRLTGGVAHDFNNLLQVIATGEGLIRLLLGKALNPREERALDSIRRAADHGAVLTQQLLAYARRQPLANVPLDLHVHLRASTDLLLSAAGPAVDLRVSLSALSWQVETDPAQLDAAILNIVGNARDAMPGGGTLTLTASDVVLPDPQLPELGDFAGDYACLLLTDDGAGMSEEVAREAFEPFYTTKPLGKGTGLGLSQVYGFAIQSRGMAFIRREAQGTTIGLLLPRSAARPASPPRPQYGDLTDLAGLRLLCVEDDPAVAETTVALLEGLGAQVALAGDADVAMAMDLAGFDLVLSDVMMPGSTDGIGLARWLAAHWPALPVVLCSGYMLDPHRLQSLQVEFIRKPYPIAGLLASIRRALSRPGEGGMAERPAA